MISYPFTLLLSVIAAALSGVIVYTSLRTRERVLSERLAARETLLKERETELIRVEGECSDLSAKERTLASECATLLERVRGLEGEIEVLREVEARFAQTFKSVSHDVLVSNSKSFIEMASMEMEKYRSLSKEDLSQSLQSVHSLVNPIQEVIGKMENKIGEIEKERSASHSTLSEQIRTLTSLNDSLRRETAQLSTALRAPNVRGQWGEVQLRRVVELAGMLEYCDFVTQESVTNDEKRLRPDLVVRIPGGGSIVIDAKAPLDAYLESFNATSEEKRSEKLLEHADAIRRHLGALSQKNYFQQFQPSPDFVVLFIPGEAFFSAALQADPSLLQSGVERNVILATPTTLIALLKAVSYGWRQQDIERNAHEIKLLGRELFDRLRKFTEHLSKTRTGLERATRSFNDAVASFETRVMVSARRFEELGIASAGELETVSPLSDAPRLVTVESSPSDSAEPLSSNLAEDNLRPDARE